MISYNEAQTIYEALSYNKFANSHVTYTKNSILPDCQVIVEVCGCDQRIKTYYNEKMKVLLRVCFYRYLTVFNGDECQIYYNGWPSLARDSFVDGFSRGYFCEEFAGKVSKYLDFHEMPRIAMLERYEDKLHGYEIAETKSIFDIVFNYRDVLDCIHAEHESHKIAIILRVLGEKYGYWCSMRKIYNVKFRFV